MTLLQSHLSATHIEMTGNQASRFSDDITKYRGLYALSITRSSQLGRALITVRQRENTQSQYVKSDQSNQLHGADPFEKSSKLCVWSIF
jgi:hypothetical protein